MSFGSQTAKITYTCITELAHLCHRYLTMKLRHRIEYTQAYFFRCQRKNVRGNEAFFYNFRCLIPSDKVVLFDSTSDNNAFNKPEFS